MKRKIFIILLVICITAVCGCSAAEQLPPHLIREDGVLYIDIWTDEDDGYVNTGNVDSSEDNSHIEVDGIAADVEGITPIPVVKFESIEDAVYRIYNNDFTEEQLKELALEKRDENGRVEIFDVKWYTKMPAVRDLPLQWISVFFGDSSVGYEYDTLDGYDIQCKEFSMRFHAHTDNFETALKNDLYERFGFKEFNGGDKKHVDEIFCYVEEDGEYRGYPAKVETHLCTSLDTGADGKVEWVKFFETCVTYTTEVNGASVTIAEILSAQPKVDLSNEDFVLSWDKDLYPASYPYLRYEYEKLLKYQTLEGRLPEKIIIQYIDEERNLRYYMLMEGFEEIPTTEWILSFANIEK